jgi:multidrug efflux pump subunit AcrA (membrane-fusion protein)
VRFENGQTVTQGTVLIELDDAELQVQRLRLPRN